MAEQGETRLAANGITLAWDAFGDADAPALLLVMGLGTQMIAWPEVFCEDLARRGYRVIRFDNRDVGLSTKLDGVKAPGLVSSHLWSLFGRRVRAPYTLADMANDAAGLLDELGIETAHIVGASMGGMIAQHFASAHPERTRSLVSLMSSSGEPRLPGPTLKVTRHMFLSRPRAGDSPEIYIDFAVRTLQLIGSPGYPTPLAEQQRRVRRSHERSFYPEGFKRHIAAIIADGSRAALLRALRVPTLVIHGDADPLVPAACGIDTAAQVPDARLELIEGMGHDLPDALMPRLARLVDEHASAADRAAQPARRRAGVGQ